MADASIDSLSLVLFDNWPDGPAMLESLPTDGFLGATHHNVTTAIYDAGTKCFYYNAGNGGTTGVAGWSTFIYLKGKAIAEANPACAVKQGVVGSLATDVYQVTNDPDQCLLCTGASIGAYLLSTMKFSLTATKYGWFWCAGVVPEIAVTGLGGAYPTDDSVIAGGPIQWNDLADTDAIGIGNHDTTLGICGISLVVDA